MKATTGNDGGRGDDDVNDEVAQGFFTIRPADNLSPLPDLLCCR